MEIMSEETSPKEAHDVEVEDLSSEKAALGKEGQPLSIQQLVLRRSLATFCMLLVLAAGITANVIFTRLLR